MFCSCFFGDWNSTGALLEFSLLEVGTDVTPRMATQAAAAASNAPNATNGPQAPPPPGSLQVGGRGGWKIEVEETANIIDEIWIIHCSFQIFTLHLHPSKLVNPPFTHGEVGDSPRRPSDPAKSLPSRHSRDPTWGQWGEDMRMAMKWQHHLPRHIERIFGTTNHAVLKDWDWKKNSYLHFQDASED